MRSLEIDTAAVFEPLLAPSRYKGAFGGRGSGKSHFFAGLLVEDCLRQKGLRAVCIREVQKDLKDSAKLLIEDKLQVHELGSADGFKVWKDCIETPGDGIIIFRGMRDYSAESIKSLEGFDRAWVEEGQTLSRESLNKLRPTIRKPGSELWFSWNPRHPKDPVDAFFRGDGAEDEDPDEFKVVRANWRDNPWFPGSLDKDRLRDRRRYPDEYEHIWEGDYATILAGAYYAKLIAEARRAGRVGQVGPDPLMPVKAFWDLGVGKSDATAIWIAQFVGREIRVLDYYEAINQPLGAHLEWMRQRGWGQAMCYLPHDGSDPDKVTAIRFEDHLRSAGFEVETVSNQGKGAAHKRIEATRRLFPSIHFDAEKCLGGLDALAWYHEKIDDKRGVGLGPDHDWSSHAADAFGLMAVAYEPPVPVPTAKRDLSWVL